MKLMLITDNRDTAVGMRLAGVEYTLVQSAEECKTALYTLIEDGSTGIILITQSLYEQCADTVDEIKNTVRTPLITEIPDSDKPFNSNAITRYVSDAMGI